ncbi:MerR family transcriptional regulator [Anaerotignum sp.]|uniref:MerR family transcriptional regulator n=1 Tax=Anaerotignum sp. TaxID=2039241 RepID=UPI0028A9046F|nr:MerR family transcriptional regulator [Anaerotignum sp.]
MENHSTLFTAGQFAKLHNINKRTLHYYDEIGLFSPLQKGENGYRYYTYLQSPTLEMILAFRELGMSIEVISDYMKNPSVFTLSQLIDTKTQEIDEKIRQLKEIRNLFMKKKDMLQLSQKLDLSTIEIVEYPEEYLLLSRSITGTYDLEDYAVLLEHMNELQPHRLFNKSYGSMIAVENVMEDNMEDYYCFFTKVETCKNKSDYFLKPKGSYIRTFFKGSWDDLPLAYERIKAFAEEKGLSLHGYAFEEGINEMAISSMDEYVTQITILCK